MKTTNTKAKLFGTFATIGLATLLVSPAHAGSLDGTFSVFLDCNNDGMSQIRSHGLNGWKFTQDAEADNTDGPLYDMLGMATTVTDDGKVVVVLNGNTSIDGEGNDRSGNTIAWGDLFFTADGAGSFQDAQDSGSLFAIHFSQANDSSAIDLGVYNSVTAQGVGMHNFGHRTYGDYMSLVDSDVENFFGDIDTSDLTGANPYFNTTGPGYNVMASGTRAYNDGFTFIDNARLSSLGFDASGFNKQGTELIAFEFNLAALTTPLPLEDQAEQLGVEWVWANDLQGYEDEYDRLNTEQKRIWNEEIKDHNNENKDIRNATPGFAETNAARNDAKAVRDADNKRNKYEKFIDETQAKLDAEEVRKTTDPTWNTKDDKYVKFLQDEIKGAESEIQKLEDEYGSALDTAQEDWTDANRAYNQLIDQIREDNPRYVYNEEEMLEPTQRRDEVKAQRNEQNKLRQALEDEIQGILAAARQDIVAQADAEEQAIEEEFGKRTSAEDRHQTTLFEGEPETASVPEPSGIAGLLALGLGFSRLRRNRSEA